MSHRFFLVPGEEGGKRVFGGIWCSFVIYFHSVSALKLLNFSLISSSDMNLSSNHVSASVILLSSKDPSSGFFLFRN